MKQENKELLLIDLCARLPYGVICYWRIGSELTLNLTEYDGQLTGINKVEIEDSSDHYYDCYFNVCNDSNGNSFQNEDVPIEIVKPYLRPLSSMTKEEKKDILQSLNIHGDIDNEGNLLLGVECDIITLKVCKKYLGELNKRMFDVCHMIEKGLALQALEGMYK